MAPDPARLWFADRYINHWDHKQAGLLALTAVMPDAPTRVMFQELEEEGLEPYEIPNLWLVIERARHLRRHHRYDRAEDRRPSRKHVSEGGDGAAPFVRERAAETGEDAGHGVSPRPSSVPVLGRG